MKFRIFHAPQVYNTWEKVFILTEDGQLYCQYLDRFKKSIIKKDDLNFENFRATDFSWGKEVVGNRGVASSNYQDCKNELSWEEYKTLQPSQKLRTYSLANINDQIRWVEGYLSQKGLSPEDWDDRFVS